MAEAGAEVLPEGRGGAGIIGGEKQSQHEEEAADTGGTHEDAEDERDADSQFAVSDQESDGSGVVQDESAENIFHEGIGAAFR